MSNFDFSGMSETELLELAKQIQEEVKNFKAINKARQAFFRAYDEVIEAGGHVYYFGEPTGQSDMYSMDKRYFYIE